MSAHSSSPNTSLNKSEFFSCFEMPDIMLMDIVSNVTKILLLVPLSVFILYLAYQRWKQQGSLTAASHCDVFTYHLAVMELFTVLGTVFSILSSYYEFTVLLNVGQSLLTIPYNGEYFFQVLTCVERYLAVVHPHTYMGLKTARGIRIRTVIIGCVWLLCFTWMAISVVVFPDMPIELYLVNYVLSLAVIIFCSLSVLKVLIQSRPGERGQGKGKVDKSKQRTFQTIMLIFVVLSVWFAGFIVALFVNSSESLSEGVKCMVMQSCIFINIPSSLVLPLLYLQRAGKLSFFHPAGEKR